MAVDCSILEGAYLRDLLAQPLAVADTAEGLRALPPLPITRALANRRRIVLTGLGSSFHGLHPLTQRLVRAGHTAVMIETGELIQAQAALLNEHSLVIAVSQSGRSVELLQLLDLVGSRGARPYLLGVTNTPDSPLARRADALVPLRAGAEFSVSCKTYLASLTALAWLGEELTGGNTEGLLRDAAPVACALRDYLARWREHVTQLAVEFSGLSQLFLLGRGASLAAVGTGALILKESTRFHAEGMSCPAFRHGPFEMISPGLQALVFAGETTTLALNQRLVRDIRAAGGQARLVGEDSAQAEPFHLPAVPEPWRPLWEMLPVQMLSLALAALAGREPGRFERASKITTIA